MDARIDPMLREWIYAREMLRRLKFSSDELFFVVIEPGSIIVENGEEVTVPKPVLSLLIKADEAEFSWIIGMTNLPMDKIKGAYNEACEIWNASKNSPEEDQAYYASRSFSQRFALLDALRKKGFACSM